MQELVGASVMKQPGDTWRAKVSLIGSTVERDFDDRMVAWRFVWRWLSEGRTD